jgi:uncharacterized membrane protein YraQ (UPF0718 family)
MDKQTEGCACGMTPRAENGKGKNLMTLAAGIFLAAVYVVLEPAVHAFVFDILKLDPSSRMAEALRFFLYDFPKVMILLTVIVFFVGVIRSFFTPEKTRKVLEGKPLFAGNIMASLLGVVTPFCSCSAVPLFLGFVEAGIPLGVTLSFLIAAPMINEIALVLLFGLFGWKTALLYASTGLAIAISAGWIIGKLKLEHLVEDWVYEVKMGAAAEEENPAWNERISAGRTAVKEIVAKVWIFVALGIALGAVIHGYVPENLMASIMGKDAWWSVPAAVVLGVPMYANAAGIIPIIQALLEKGAALGTALAFMMSVIGLSLPEMIILRKVLKLKMIFIFAGIVAAGIMIVGFLFNLIY